MKRLLLFAIPLFISSIANAAVIHVATRPVAMGGGASLLVFNYNENGRAWIEETDYNGYTEGGAVSNPHYHLPGLHFDPTTREIVYGRVVCANVVPIALGFSVYKTGRCELRAMPGWRAAETDAGLSTTRLETIEMDVR